MCDKPQGQRLRGTARSDNADLPENGNFGHGFVLA